MTIRSDCAIMSIHTPMKDTDFKALLARSAFFRDLSPEELNQVVATAHMRSVERERFLFQQGDPATTLYVVTAGQARLLQLAPDGNQVLLNYVSVGEMFGGIAFLGEGIYPVTAQAVSDCTTATWDGETMARLMEGYPRLSLNAMQHMAVRIQELQDRLRELATERVERRIANTLVRLAQQTGKKTEEGVLIGLPLSRQDIAEMTGTTLYTVSRTLSRWEQEGIVDAGRERVLIRFPHKLVAIAEDLPGKTRGDL